jgi:aminobenzoyl-glutamate transport protein
MSSASEVKRGMLDKFLDRVERAGNKIPEPFMLFIWLSIGIVVLSFVLSNLGFSAVHPATKKTITVFNLLSFTGIQKMISNAVKNFASFPALGLVLVTMLGVGVCEKSGMFSAILRGSMSRAKGSMTKVVLILSFLAVMADAEAGTGFVIMPQIGAMLFAALGENPLIGIFCGYAGVSGAFAANLLITSVDVLLVSFTQSAVNLVNPQFQVHAAMDYYFKAVSVFGQTFVCTLVTLKIVQPRLSYKTTLAVDSLQSLSSVEKNALKWANIGLAGYFLLVLAGSVPENGIFRDAKTHSLIANSAPIMAGLPLVLSLFFFVPGIIYGIKSGTIQGAKGMVGKMGETMADMGPYIALTFAMSQFISYFAWSNMGIIFAIKGAAFLGESGFPIILTLIGIVLLGAIINMFVGSASSKWAIMAPVFVPMFMFLGYHPAVVQMTYRIGDSITNPITPGLPYFGMLLALAQKYDKNIGMGTLMANMLPYSIGFAVFWIIQLVIWFYFGLPMGPGAPILLPK